MSIGSITPAQWEEFYAIATKAGVTLPLEQTQAWDSFDRAVVGREPWGRLVYRDGRGNPRALISLTRFELRHFFYLWAKHGPVWLGEEPSPEEESDFRQALLQEIRSQDSLLVFVRMHAIHKSDDCHELLQTKTYDRTVILDLDHPDDEAFLSSFRSRGRRDVRKALRNEQLTYADETSKVREVFDELYAILLETGERDGFRAAPKEAYVKMIETLGPQHSRLYVARKEGREPLAWSIEVLWEKGAAHYYAASSYEGRKMGAADALLYKAACWLREDGVRTFDLMGVDSPRAPELAGVRAFKTKFITGEPVDTPGAWDIPVRPFVYTGLTKSLAVKRLLVKKLARLRNAVKVKG